MHKPTTYPIVIDRYGTDLTQRASISTMINYVLNVAGWDADAKGFGVGKLNEENHTWVLSRFALEIDYLPRTGEHIDITTWISDYNRLITTRCFTLTTSDGKTIGGAVSQWCMLDLQKRKAIDLSQLHHNYNEYVLSNYAEPIERPRRITSLEPTSSRIHCATYSDIDFNGHVNSLRYIDLMLDTLPIDTLKQNRPLRVDLQYLQECYHLDSLAINYELRDNISMVEILRNGDTSAVKGLFEWR